MKKLHAPYLCLPLACVFALTACAPGGGTADADAEPLPIEVPPPVEQTNEGLTIFYTDYDSYKVSILDAAVNQYNLQHPDQPITVEKVFTDDSPTSHSDAYKQMITEVMAGEGPDLIFYDAITQDIDIEKMVRRGVFADLEPYFAADDFDWTPYNQGVMEGGVWDGHRLLIPLEYKIPMLYTSQTALDETGFAMENCTTFDGFLAEVEKVQADAGQTRDVFRNKLAFYDFAKYAGIPYLDYDRQKVDLSFPELERGATIYKNLTEAYYDFDSLAGAGDIRDGKALWISPGFALDGFFMGPEVINTFDELVMMPIRDIEGGIQAEITFAVAARSSSPNLQNAYAFIKLLLSEEFQQDTIQYRWLDYSVLDATNEEYFRWYAIDRTQPLVPPVGNAYGFKEVDVRQEDFDALMACTGQVSGTYFAVPETQFIESVRDYIIDETSYKKAASAAESQLNIYLSE